jgi:hypothetical protein
MTGGNRVLFFGLITRYRRLAFKSVGVATDGADGPETLEGSGSSPAGVEAEELPGDGLDSNDEILD